ncbi:hypothetical protein CRE_23027 [Caenorhabditis remanei]|uniref:Uncharacterized protein n=1 Tax=Caenorhabditis remanei TaxID=31234 RepID=E3N4F6_CAERE|nr:hypothetical protein CRE_23027 [Caenorhabditis remanei]
MQEDCNAKKVISVFYGGSKIPPEFTLNMRGIQIMSRIRSVQLNADQLHYIDQILKWHPIIIGNGPFGSGKSMTMATAAVLAARKVPSRCHLLEVTALPHLEEQPEQLEVVQKEPTEENDDMAPLQNEDQEDSVENDQEMDDEEPQVLQIMGCRLKHGVIQFNTLFVGDTKPMWENMQNFDDLEKGNDWRKHWHVKQYKAKSGTKQTKRYRFQRDETVKGILNIADMYDTPPVHKKCEQFLIKKSEKSLKIKLQMSTRYKMKKLQNFWLAKINTKQDIRLVMPGDLSELERLVASHALARFNR